MFVIKTTKFMSRLTKTLLSQKPLQFSMANQSNFDSALKLNVLFAVIALFVNVSDPEL